MSTARPEVGTVLAVCIGPGGIPKHPVDEAVVTPDGVVGDAHRFHLHGGRDRAVCLFSIEDYRALAADGVPCDAPGTFGENLLTAGLDFAELRSGDRLRVGDEVLLEVHDVRVPCKTLKSVDRRFPDLMVGRSGFVCRVLQGGTLAPTQAIELVLRAEA